MPSFHDRLERVESKWLKPLSDHCGQLFDDIYLPSHDQRHHLRVWHHAKTVTRSMADAGVEASDDLLESLIIAALFHDTGLIRSPDETHGLESRNLCEAWLRELNQPLQYTELLHAIEHHDDKSLNSSIKPLASSQDPDLLPLLAAADDMDAFGYIGIYRYAEIYLMRGIARTDLPVRILENLEHRFLNMARAFEGLQGLMQQQSARYQITRNFFLRLVQSNAALDEKPSAEEAFLRYIELALDQKMNVLTKERIIEGTGFDAFLLRFFGELETELAYFT